MQIILLNWAAGENDPFTYFNEQLQRQLEGLGHAVYIVPLDGPVSSTIEAIHSAVHIDLAFTWQGIGSALRLSGRNATIWELLGIPLACLHGDHPCHCLQNHQQSSRHLLHLYGCMSFTRDANRLIQREWPAAHEPMFNLFSPPVEAVQFVGDYFVFPKNLRNVDETRRAWKVGCEATTYRLLSAGADAIVQEFHSGNVVNHHELILDFLPGSIAEAVRAGQADRASIARHLRILRELDHVHRNVAAAFVIDSLPDVPIHVYGRGWEHFSARGNPNHVFRPFDRVAQGDSQFHSAFGIFDVSPVNDSLHDRTLRAMRIGAGFLTGTSWRQGEEIHDEFADLFFSGTVSDLETKVRLVRNDPDAHRERTRRFSVAYDELLPLDHFIGRITRLAAQRGLMLAP